MPVAGAHADPFLEAPVFDDAGKLHVNVIPWGRIRFHHHLAFGGEDRRTSGKAQGQASGPGAGGGVLLKNLSKA
ncbi:hypothetical protein QRO11_13195 [Paracidovorax citrulli]|uniref:Uncharacterized protein n=1 Tax=Paracidovorax citrulli TaxID=80869 RepID=A0ABY9AJS0_PARCI|nr:hypothetical protein [Paracidovorax citrulli]QCX12572.1 hypothetical protein APS58_3856 [Paracidovorax citrulli]UEG44452.1 hypothetical protein LKW27_12270 [Paracidovorax citrulli]UMT83609.1 hypothetical protein FRC75_09650 [Paracidovorax citrulli]UMT88176.1 hypothetical protein FRC90_08900 [Paracidovorax citrulli]UMT97127.1 hypothetical protein FRC97_20255 [Paracidovorax citrulli]